MMSDDKPEVRMRSDSKPRPLHHINYCIHCGTKIFLYTDRELNVCAACTERMFRQQVHWARASAWN